MCYVCVVVCVCRVLCGCCVSSVCVCCMFVRVACATLCVSPVGGVWDVALM